MEDGLRSLVTVARVEEELGAGERQAFLVYIELAVIEGVRQFAVGREAHHELRTLVDGGRFLKMEVIARENFGTEQQVRILHHIQINGCVRPAQ